MTQRVISRAPLTPRYARIQQDLAAQIAGGSLRPGDALPSETVLCARYRVSRMTVRHALRNLEHDGEIVREQGRGSFVAPPRLEKTVTGLVGFSEEMRRRGLTPTSVLIHLGRRPAAGPVAAALEVEAGREVTLVKRLRLADGTPLALEEAYLALPIEPAAAATASLYTYLEERYGLRPGLARERVSAVIAAVEEATYLHVAPGSPLLAVARSVYTTARQPLEYVRTLYRADRYTLEVVRYRE
jgi:GntR family transcriptional regulator